MTREPEKPWYMDRLSAEEARRIRADNSKYDTIWTCFLIGVTMLVSGVFWGTVLFVILKLIF